MRCLVDAGLVVSLLAASSSAASQPLRPQTLAQRFGSLSEDQIAEAIALGTAGDVPLVKVSGWASHYDVYIEGPVARIAAAAREATRLYRPFDQSNVTDDMAERSYRIIVT